jgi:WD40 repeat protein
MNLPVSEHIAIALRRYARSIFRPPRRIFRDEDHLVPENELPDLIDRALQASEFLILIASRDSARSIWVEDELRTWCEQMGRSKKLIFVLVNGDIIFDPDTKQIDWKATNAIPSFMHKHLEKVPLFIDLRDIETVEQLDINDPTFRKGIEAITARLVGVSPEDIFGKARRIYRRNIQFVSAICLVAITAAVVAFLFQRQARESELIARNSERAAKRELVRANKLQQEATASALSAQRALVRAESLLYVNQIRLADRERTAGRYFAAEKILQSTRSEFRDWEFYYLLSLMPKILNGHQSKVNSVAVSRDGKKIVSGGKDGLVKIWDTDGGSELLTFPGREYNVTKVAFAAEGEQIISKSNRESIVRIRDALNGKLLATIPIDRLIEMVTNSEGSLLATTHPDHSVQMWDQRNGKRLMRLVGHHRNLRALAMSGDGKRVACADSGATIKIWDALRGTELITLAGPKRGISCLALNQDGTRIVGGCSHHSIHLWNAQTGREMFEITGNFGFIRSLSFSPDGRHVLCGGDDGAVHVWDAVSGEAIISLNGNFGGVKSITFSPKGTPLVTGHSSGKIVLWRALEGTEFRKLSAPDVINCVTLSPDGTLVASANRNRTVTVWDIKTGKKLWNLKEHLHTPGLAMSTLNKVNAVAFSADSSRIVSGAFDRTLKVWDITSGSELITLTGHRSSVNSVAVSRNGDLIVSGSSDMTVKVWDAKNGTELNTFPGHEGVVTSVAISLDGKRVASGGEDATVRVWELATGVELLTLTGHRSMKAGWRSKSVNSVAFSPDGTRIASGSHDQTVKIWDAESGAELQTLIGHQDKVTSVRWNANGSRIISASKDKNIKIWDSNSGEEFLTLSGHSAEVTSVTMGNGNQWIVSGSRDATITVWGIP